MISVEQLLADYEALKLREAFPSGEAANNRCSTLGHPCTAYCYFDRVTPANKRKPMEARLAKTFAEGRAHERLLQIDLQQMGYDLQQQQQGLYWAQYKIAGHRDFIISRGGPPYVRAELKSCSPFIFRVLHTPKDVREHRWFVVQKWYSQVALYMWLDSVPEYWLILKNKVGGDIKIIPFHMDDELTNHTETLLKKAEAVNGYVEEVRKNSSWAIPAHEKINDPRICPDCDFYGVCGPQLRLGPGLAVVTDDDIARMLDKHGELEEGAGEYEELDGELKDYFRKLLGPDLVKRDDERLAVCGDWSIKVKRGERKGKEGKDPVVVFYVTFGKLAPEAKLTP